MKASEIYLLSRVKDFVFAGKSTFTLKNPNTGSHKTYRVVKREKKGEETVWFVSYLYGGNNLKDYKLMAVIEMVDGIPTLKGVKEFCLYSNQLSTTYLGINWLIDIINDDDNDNFERMEFYHEGRCGACGRKLTTPASVSTGIGPICAGRI